MNTFLAIPLMIGSAAYLIYTSWRMQHHELKRPIGYGQILVALGGLTWGLVGWYPYTPELTGNLSILAGSVLLVGVGLILYGQAREGRDEV